MPALGRCLGEGVGNLLFADGLAVVAVEVGGLHRHEIDHALELVFLADRDLHRNRVAAELVAELAHDSLEVGAGAVHLVDERQPRHLVTLHLAVDRHRLALHAAHGAEHEDGAVEHPQAAFHFDGEVDVAGGIDEIDVAVVPLHARGGTGDRDATLALEIHVVHGRAVAAALHLLDAVNAASVVENPLRERGLTGVDVGRDAHVAELGQVHGRKHLRWRRAGLAGVGTKRAEMTGGTTENRPVDRSEYTPAGLNATDHATDPDHHAVSRHTANCAR